MKQQNCADKLLCVFLSLSGLFLLPPGAYAQGQTGLQASAIPDKVSTNYSVVFRGANSRVWQQVVPRATNQQGRVAYQTNSYTELATGMNHLVNGQWVPSSDEITITRAGGMVTNCIHAVSFAANINISNAVEILTPDGKELRTHILGLSYYDASTGSNVLFAELQNSTGLLVTSNQVVYPNAFTGASADVRYANTIGSFSQDIIIRAQLPSPAGYGLSPTSSNIWLQVWTEFLNPPAPAIEPVPAIGDVRLDFGAVKMIEGKAFSIGNDSASVPVIKQWVSPRNSGRTFLIEQVPLSAVAASLQALPPATAGGTTNAGAQAFRYPGFPNQLPPPSTVARRESESIKVASDYHSPDAAFAMDYITLTAGETNFVFAGDQTYYISGVNFFSGTTVFEGQTVVKILTNNSGPLFTGPINCTTSAYRPAIITCSSDDTVGQVISGSSGIPVSNGRFTQESTSAITLSNLQIRYVGLQMNSACPGMDVWNCQIVGSPTAISLSGSGYVNLHNVLLSSSSWGFSGGTSTPITGEQVTLDAPTVWSSGSSPHFSLTNCIFIGYFQPPASLSTNCLVINPAGTVFQSMGAGNFYLASSSPYQSVGTTNISAAMLSILSNKTTYPPLWLTNTITTATTLFPQAQRETAAPDLGYAYDPIDYLSSCVVTNATLTLTNGVSLAYYNNIGIWLSTGGGLVSQGTPLQRNVLAYYTLVQEQPTNLWGAANPALNSELINLTHTNYAVNPSVNLRFTSLYVPDAASCFLNTAGGTWLTTAVTLRDCEIYGAGSEWEEDDSSNAVFTFQNNLFYEASINAFYTADVITLYNNLFYGNASESLSEFNFSPGTVTNHDNVFDGLSSVGLDGTNGWNAFIAINTNYVSPLPMTNDVVLSSFTWQTGPLGNFYQPTNSLLIDKGSRTADLAGLYHYTTQTNEVIESNSEVDIGYHYVALGANGLPLDSNGDGIPDYLEDANGNGIYDAGDLGNWAAGATNADTTGVVGLQVYTPLK